MAAADRLTGSDLVVIFGGTTITGDQTSFGFDRNLDTVDVSAGNEQSRYFKDTLEGLEFNLSIFDADQSYLASILPRSTGTLEVRKEGTGSGKPTFSFSALITGYSEDMPFDGALEIEITGVRNGDMITEVGTTQ